MIYGFGFYFNKVTLNLYFIDKILCINERQLKVLIINLFSAMDRQKSKSRISLVRTISLSPNYSPEDGQQEESINNEQQIQQSKKQPVNLHQFILSEFKEKYDQLKSQFEVKKKEADSLLYDKKKLQIELLNHNVEYYEKQIVRLRGEVEKYQMENQQNKHKFFVAENSRKDLEAISKVRQQELKQTLKQLEKQKIHVVELKHQIVEKDRNFTSIIEDLQKSNNDISQKYESTLTLLQSSQSDLKTKNTQNDQLKKKVEQLEKLFKQKQEENNSNLQKYELNQYRFKHRIQDLEEELKEIHSKQNEKIKKLEAQVKELESKRKSQQFLLVQKNDAANYSQNLRKKQEQIAKLQEKLREIIFSYNQRQKRIQTLQGKLQNVCSIELLNQSEQKLIDTLNKHKNVEKSLQNRITFLEKELQMSKLKTSNNSGTSYDPRMKADFQQLLKDQIQENSKLKMEISLKIDEIFSLKNLIQEQHIKQSLLQNQIDILRKRQRAEQKNSKIGFEIQIQNLKNDVESLRRKLQVTQTKLNIKIKQVKDKDSFISSVIIGRSKQEDVPFVMAQLKRIFEAEYVNKLSESNLKLQDLQSKINAK